MFFLKYLKILLFEHLRKILYFVCHYYGIRMGVEVNAILRVSKAAWVVGFHEKGLSLQVRVVNNVVILE